MTITSKKYVLKSQKEFLQYLYNDSISTTEKVNSAMFCDTFEEAKTIRKMAERRSRNTFAIYAYETTLSEIPEEINADDIPNKPND